MNSTAQDFIRTFEEKAESIEDEALRSKKYRAGIATFAQKSINSGDMSYLEAAIGFADRISDEHDRSKAFVDIIRGTAGLAGNAHNIELVRKAFDLLENTDKGLDRSHSLQGIVTAMAETGASTNSQTLIEASQKLAQTIEYDTFRSMAQRSIARALYKIGQSQSAGKAANMSLDIIDSSAGRVIYKASAYIDLSKLFLDLGMVDKAKLCIEKAATNGEILTNEFERSSIFGSIAQTQVRMGARTKDRTLFEDSVRSFDLVKKEFYRTTTGKILKKVLINFNEENLLKNELD